MVTSAGTSVDLVVGKVVVVVEGLEVVTVAGDIEEGVVTSPLAWPSLPVPLEDPASRRPSLITQS